MAASLMFCQLGRRRNDRVFRERFSLHTMDDEEIRKRYRFRKENIGRLVTLLEPSLRHSTNRSHSLSTELQILIALRFYASGSFLQVLGDTTGVDKSTVSRIVLKVSQSLVSLAPRFIKWPADEELTSIKSEFLKLAGFPVVIGCIDGTHARIQGPSENEPAFVNRKGYHSINVQAICDNAGKFTNIVARWPGSTHDSHIFNMSGIKQDIERNFRSINDGIILGDSGYACKPYLMTPYLRPSSQAEERFNTAHSKTRVAIERKFGWWKRRFHVLHSEIRMKPERVCTIIGACAVLHNLAIMYNEPPMDEDITVNGNIQGNYNGPEDGKNIRNYITQHYF
ncbi:putative nuclease HARBI1 [Saccostrea echinata]|uniref:putative nuclease HARBI1 n=1 Tax=Saccostrea echinata TaxID=191078 RepID=UPI002A80E001|nr:putative nuclease HARBI1 [Saccostrea echinata]